MFVKVLQNIRLKAVGRRSSSRLRCQQGDCFRSLCVMGHGLLSYWKLLWWQVTVNTALKLSRAQIY